MTTFSSTHPGAAVPAETATAPAALHRTDPTARRGGGLGGNPNRAIAAAAAGGRGGALRWGFVTPEGPAGSSQVGFGVAPNAQFYAADAPAISKVGFPGSGRLGLSGFTQLAHPGLGDALSMTQNASAFQAANTDASGNLLPMELPSHAGLGGHTTKDFGQFSKTATVLAGDGAVTKPFTADAVSYKHGEAIILHQWANCGDVLVNCQSAYPQSFICQYGISKGSMAWTYDISRTCDKFWFGVTTDKDLDCNDWIADHDAAYMISEEGEIEEATYGTYVPKTGREHVGRPAMIQQAEGVSRWVKLKAFAPAADVPGIWERVMFVLDMDACELHMQVRNGAGDTSQRMRLFRGLPRGFKVYPCLSMCNAGQVVFMKYGE